MPLACPRNAASLNSVIMQLDLRVIVAALFGGRVEEQGGIREVVSGEEFYDFVLEVSASSTLCQRELGNSLIPLSEAV